MNAMNIKQSFLDFYAKRALPSGGIVVAVSGGADSMLLLALLSEFADALGVTISALNLNHMLREEAAGEAALVADYCAKLGVPVSLHSCDIAAEARLRKMSVEQAGREVRYELLRAEKERLGFSYIATAHHADDNAETVLLRLIRGTGVAGLSAIEPLRGDIVRPLLFATKDEILSACEEYNIPYATDASNFSSDYLRNRVRSDIMPLLRRENPNIAASLRKLSDTAAQLNDFVQSELDKAELTVRGGEASVSLGDFCALHPYLRARLLNELAGACVNSRDIGFSQINAVIALAEKNGGEWECDVSGGRFFRRGERLYFSSKPKEKKPAAYAYPLSKAAVHIFAAQRMVIKTKSEKKSEKNWRTAYKKIVDYDKIVNRLFVRSRLDGDAFRPFGLGGTKKLKKYLYEKRLTMYQRELCPIICDGDGIISVGSFEIDERVKLTDTTAHTMSIGIYFYGGNE